VTHTLTADIEEERRSHISQKSLYHWNPQIMNVANCSSNQWMHTTGLKSGNQYYLWKGKIKNL
jgi:hypothetical protein